MVFLLDADMIFKLAACDLLDDLPTILNCERGDLRVIPTAKYQACRIKGLGDAAKARALAFCEEIEDCPAPKNLETLERLQDAGIDDGEAILFATAAEIDATCILTSDKRALADLTKSEALTDVCDAIGKSVYLLETLLLIYGKIAGFFALRKHAVEGLALDGMLRLCFSKGLLTDEANAMDGLHSHLRSEIKKSGGLLVEIPDK